MRNSQVNQDIIDEVRSRSDIVEVIGSFIPLKSSGRNTYKGLCPFHNEKTPSFHVDGNKQMFHCFGCGKGGDVFKFYMEKESVNFIDALHMLAGRAGVIIPETGDHLTREEGQRLAGARERLYRINEEFCRYFIEFLQANPDSPAGRYLQKRRISFEEAAKYKIGAVPDEWTSCLNHGLRLGYTVEELHTAGILRRKEESGRYYDHFKGRLTFAIENEQGRVVGFSARSLEDKPLNGGKYINTTETPIFKKGNLLYALPLSRDGMAKRNMAILCEGQLDAIAFHRANIPCAMAPQGTGFTESQARLIRRHCNKVFLAFDADAAGQKAILRAIEILLPLSMEINVIRFPGGKDPDELYNSGGAAAMEEALTLATPWMDTVIAAATANFDQSSPVGKSQAVSQVAEYLLKVTNPVEFDGYVRECAARLAVSESSFLAQLNHLRTRERRTAEFRPAEREIAKPLRAAEKINASLLTLLKLAVHYESAARLLADVLSADELPADSDACKVLNIAISAALEGEHDKVCALIGDFIRDKELPEISEIIVGDVSYRADDVDKALQDSVKAYKLERAKSVRDRLIAKMAYAATFEERMQILTELQKYNN